MASNSFMKIARDEVHKYSHTIAGPERQFENVQKRIINWLINQMPDAWPDVSTLFNHIV